MNIVYDVTIRISLVYFLNSMRTGLKTWAIFLLGQPVKL